MVYTKNIKIMLSPKNYSQIKFQKSAGFTVVEMLVTVIVAAMFVAAFYQLFVILVQINAQARQTAQASDLAYSNMRRYPTATSTALACVDSTTVTNLIPASGSPTAAIDTDYPELGSVTEQLTAQFPYGCSSNYNLIKLVSTVKYNSNMRTVSHATYVN